MADGGTIFLDEVGELKLDLQVRLLRALQDGVIDKIGETETITVDVRVIAVTNRELEKAVEDGLFREDLYYRLCVVPIKLPPLRKRRKAPPLCRRGGFYNRLIYNYHFPDLTAMPIGRLYYPSDSGLNPTIILFAANSSGLDSNADTIQIVNSGWMVSAYG